MAFIPCWPECGHTMGQNSAADCAICLRQKLDLAQREAKKNYNLYCDTIFQRDRAREEIEQLKRQIKELEERT